MDGKTVLQQRKKAMNEKSELINPQKAYFNGKFKEKLQKAPGVQAEMERKPDCGEDSYQGCNRLAGRKALVTGGDSGIGRAAAIAFVKAFLRCSKKRSFFHITKLQALSEQ